VGEVEIDFERGLSRLSITGAGAELMKPTYWQAVAAVLLVLSPATSLA
jgi:hypothetical protein